MIGKKMSVRTLERGTSQLPFIAMNNVKNGSRLEVAKVTADTGRKRRQGDAFGKFAAGASSWLGSKWAFVGAIAIIVLWAITGSLFHYSDTWQLVKHLGNLG
jgi:hypothetical protein